MSLAEWLNFQLLGDERGSLVALETEKNIPFPIKRVYYLFGTKEGIARGFHAHKKLWQVAICLTGKCRMILDDGENKEDVWLNDSTKGIILPPMVWHEMHDFTADCLLLVLASEYYDELDYIRDYKEFMEMIPNG